MRPAPLHRGAALVVALLSAGFASTAAAQTVPAPNVASRTATFTWDKQLLRMNVSYRDVVDGEIQKKLTELGIVAKPESVAVFNGFVKEQVEVLGPTVKGAGIKL